VTIPSPTTNLFVHAEDTRDFFAGQTIFQAGDEADVMYVVRDGAVDIVVDGVTVERVGPRGMFGEMALLDHSTRSTSAVAHTDCRLVQVSATQFMLMIRQTPYFAVDVMRLLAHRLRAMNDLGPGRSATLQSTGVSSPGGPR
jgi:CRP-like cAMP-binding protein